MNAEQDIQDLKRSVRGLKRLVGVLGMALLAIPVAAFTLREADILRVKGIIIEDDQGRARILIGAPAPQVTERVRTNPELARAAWGESGTRVYWDTLNNDTFGMLILDENGHDRVAVGGPVPDPLNGTRIAPMYGLTFHNQEGIERGGGGHMFSTAAGVDRASMGLDSQHGEGAGLIADNDGTAGLWVNDSNNSRLLFSGFATKDGLIGTKDQDRLGLLIRNPDQTSTFVGAGSTGVESLPAPE